MKNVGTRCYLIAEVAQAHDGSLGMALAYVDAAAEAGADAVKFQCHIASAESSIHEPWRVKFSLQDETRYDYWKRMEFSKDQWRIIKSRCDAKKIDFICSPFSLEAVQLLEELNMPAWKIASGEFLSQTLIGEIVKFKKPIWLSTGMVNWEEINHMVKFLRSEGADFTLFQCTTAYPCPPEKVGLSAMEEMAKQFGCKVGLSDHSGTIFAGLAAAAKGAQYLEIHVTFSKKSFGPDVPASITIEELATLKQGLEFIDHMVNVSFDKDELAKEILPMRKIFAKSLFLNEAINKDEIISSGALCEKKPGTGIPTDQLSEVIGKKALRNLPAGHMLAEGDIE